MIGTTDQFFLLFAVTLVVFILFLSERKFVLEFLSTVFWWILGLANYALSDVMGFGIVVSYVFWILGTVLMIHMFVSVFGQYNASKNEWREPL
jgi:hypothetical protein